MAQNQVGAQVRGHLGEIHGPGEWLGLLAQQRLAHLVAGEPPAVRRTLLESQGALERPQRTVRKGRVV